MRDNPTTLVYVDGRDWATAWQDAKAAVGTMYFRLTVGIGIGGKSEQGPLQVKLEAAAKVNIKFSSADRKLSVTKNDTDIGATIGPNGTKSQVGLCVLLRIRSCLFRVDNSQAPSHRTGS